MKSRKTRWLFILICALTIFPAGPGLAQGPGTKETSPAPQAPQTLQKIIVQGKIAYMEAMGGYYIQGEKPHEVFTIANQNPKVLGRLAKSGKSVTIEARPMGDLLTIEKLDGKKYQGKQEPVFK